MSRPVNQALVARVAEAVSGSLLGGLAGAGLGAVSYSPDPPVRAILDDTGDYARRKLTREEKAARRKRVALSALTGAAMGGGGTLVTSKMRRKVLKSQVGSHIDDVISGHVDAIRLGVDSTRELANNVLVNPASTQFDTRVAREIFGITNNLPETVEAKLRAVAPDVVSSAMKSIDEQVFSVGPAASIPIDRTPFHNVLKEQFGDVSNSLEDTIIATATARARRGVW